MTNYSERSLQLAAELRRQALLNLERKTQAGGKATRTNDTSGNRSRKLEK